MEEQNIDRRVRRTKQRLTLALYSLLAEKPLNKITVKELTDKADTNRGTFYRYYQDIYSMLHQVEDEFLVNYAKEIDKQPLCHYQDLENLYEVIFNFVAENSDLCLLLCGQTSDNSIIEKLKGATLNYFHKQQKSNTFEFDSYTLTFIVAGFIETLKEWLTQGMKISASQMARYIASSVQSGFPISDWFK